VGTHARCGRHRWQTAVLHPADTTAVCVDADEDAFGTDQTRADDAKKKGESHRTGFTDDENKCLCEAWLATIHDFINGAQQNTNVYWSKVVQEYNERKLHKPYEMRSDEESIKKRWTYIKHENSKFRATVDHVVNHPESGMGVMALVSNGHRHSINLRHI
jgi:hypothetical protein